MTAVFFFSLFTFGGLGDAAYAKCHSSAAPGVDWQGCRKRNLILKGSDLSGAKLAGTDFTATDLR
ncbi:MAG TPA: pentapeptide repeat-containing protein, partial [Afifellaceae bacterium]|nr:pentapeptide repeat-containing protein [Afifellaceae bacterium]